MQIDERLSKEVPTHLFQFRETVIGPITVQQLMYDIAAFAGLWFLWSQPIPLALRVVLCAFAAVTSLVIIHLKIGDYSLLDLLFLRLRCIATPAETVWIPAAGASLLAASRSKKRSIPPSVQETWIPVRGISGCYLAFSDKPMHKGKAGPVTRFSVVMEAEGRNLGLLSLEERGRVYQENGAYLAGLRFGVQYITRVEPINPDSFEPLVTQTRQVATLGQAPRLAALRNANIAFQRSHLGSSLTTRHFVVLSASRSEEAMRTPDGKPRPAWQAVLFSFGRKREDVGARQVLEQLRIRVQVVSAALGRLDVRPRLLEEEELAQFYGTCLVPGARVTRYASLQEMLAPIAVREHGKRGGSPRAPRQALPAPREATRERVEVKV
jgi:hypothetical protein